MWHSYYGTFQAVAVHFMAHYSSRSAGGDDQADGKHLNLIISWVAQLFFKTKEQLMAPSKFRWRLLIRHHDKPNGAWIIITLRHRYLAFIWPFWARCHFKWHPILFTVWNCLSKLGVISNDIRYYLASGCNLKWQLSQNGYFRRQLVVEVIWIDIRLK